MNAERPCERTAWEVMHNFLGYTYQSGIEVHDGDVLGGENGPEFKVHRHACSHVMPGTPFHNPYVAAGKSRRLIVRHA